MTKLTSSSGKPARKPKSTRKDSFGRSSVTGHHLLKPAHKRGSISLKQAIDAALEVRRQREES